MLPALALGAALAAFPLALVHRVWNQKVYFDGWVHVVGVGATAALATAAAVVLTAAGARRQDPRTVLVGTAFSIMAALLALHGLATPNVLLGSNGVVAFSGAATLPVGGAILALTALPALRRPEGVKPILVLQAVGLAVIIALGISAFLIPSMVPSVPKPGSTVALVALGAGLFFYLLLALRALRTYILTHRWSDLLVGVGIVWLAVAIVPTLTQGYWMLTWWLGHAFELIGIVMVATPVALDFTRTAQSRPLLGDLRAAELVASEEAFLGSHVRALTVRLAEKDEYTEEHTRRVALRAVQVGEELGLPRARLRMLAIGGLVHDIGKLAVPDSILKKPAELDGEEYAVIKRHPEHGYRLLYELGGFSDAVRRLVLDHHERLDGTGYPRGLEGDDLDLDTCILAVCDVYDALRSSRVYRPAWSYEDAIALLRRESGTAFDPRCVAALERVLEREHQPAHEPVARAATFSPIPAT
jgi:HD-GYP domain-containing protein (c-di-GMP phosphodiesterase class II)